MLSFRPGHQQCSACFVSDHRPVFNQGRDGLLDGYGGSEFQRVDFRGLQHGARKLFHNRVDGGLHLLLALFISTHNQTVDCLIHLDCNRLLELLIERRKNFRGFDLVFVEGVHANERADGLAFQLVGRVAKNLMFLFRCCHDDGVGNSIDGDP